MAELNAAARCDLRRACVHEFAHWAVARNLGAAGFVTIVARPADMPDAMHFGGRFQLYGELAADEWRIVALAGTVAECFDDDREISASTIVAGLHRGVIALSGSDAQLASGFDEHVVQQCLSAVKGAWHEIEAEAAAIADSPPEGPTLPCYDQS